MLQQMRDAMDGGDFSVVYQPKVSATDHRIVGFEALVRWEGSKGETISPSQFIPLAEESGLILPLGRIVLEEVCRQCRRWLDAGMGHLPIAVNISPTQLTDPDFLPFLRQLLADTGIPGNLLLIEVTETTFMQDSGTTSRVLEEVRRLGIRVSLDDFGTGYSSLSHLQQFPLDEIKIDRVFISGLDTRDADAAIVAAICILGRTMKLNVVAEGVETPEQVKRLEGLSCDEMQGYLFSRPIGADEVAALLAA